jgi:hypothetical protein
VSIIEDLIEMSKIDAKQIMPNYKGLDIENCIVELYNAIKVTIPKDKTFSFIFLKTQIKFLKIILMKQN